MQCKSFSKVFLFIFNFAIYQFIFRSFIIYMIILIKDFRNYEVRGPRYCS